SSARDSTGSFRRPIRATPASPRAEAARGITRASLPARPGSGGPRAPTQGTARSRGSMRVAFAADHAGAAMKAELIRRLRDLGDGHELIDLGGDGSDPLDDYPEFAERLGLAIQDGSADRGILICG